MYYQLLTLHSIARWLVLVTLVVSVVAAFNGLIKGRPFSGKDNALRHWTATTAHIQLMIGMILYTQSPVVKYFWKNSGAASFDIKFYSAIHSALMLSSIVVLTIGSALAKRRSTDKEKFRTMLIWFSIALIIILLAIPWPFSPLSARPYLRTF